MLLSDNCFFLLQDCTKYSLALYTYSHIIIFYLVLYPDPQKRFQIKSVLATRINVNNNLPFRPLSYIQDSLAKATPLDPQHHPWQAEKGSDIHAIYSNWSSGMFVVTNVMEELLFKRLILVSMKLSAAEKTKES